MKSTNWMTRGALAALLASASMPVMAQSITATIAGHIDSADGDVAGATVTIIDTRTGRQRAVTTNQNGSFRVTNLEVGGPYTVMIESADYQNRVVEGVMVSSSATASLNLELASGDSVEEILVTASDIGMLSQLAIGPGQVFNETTIESLPSIGRDFRDTLRIDPRVSINEGNSNAVSCAGVNNRFNSLTIDGIQQNDPFGLNASGFPSRDATPLPLDATRELSVEFAPYSVEYGQFSGCAINLLTKSGSNEFHGSAFFFYNDDGLTGSKIDGRTVSSESFEDLNWGAELGGPIIEDKLFFYVAYEETDDGGVQNAGPIGAGFAAEEVELSDVETVQSILENQFGQDTLGIARSLPETTERWFGRLDWNINDQHRFAGSYQRIRENAVAGDDFGFEDFAFQNNFAIRGSKVDIFSARLFSDWTDNFSTEIRYSRSENRDQQDPFGGGERVDENPVPRLIVDTPSGSVISGPGFFRTANELSTDLDQVKLLANYSTKKHTLTFGYELNRLSVFNLFVPNSTGTLEFDSIADLQAGQASVATVTDSFSGDINDAAANFNRSIHSLYVQDEWKPNENLTVVAGLRYDFYESGDNPPENPLAEERYGIPNTQGFDGLDLWMPRVGVTYEAPWEFYGDTTFRGGLGIFGGGDPTVWFSNAFSNFGSANAFAGLFGGGSGNCDDSALNVVDGSGNFTGVPNCLFQNAQEAALANNGNIDLVDPDFTLPSVLRWSFGFSHYTDFDGAAGGFFDDWSLDVDFMVSKRRNAADFVDLTLTPIGFAPDGRPIFNRVDPLNAGCQTSFLGPRRGFQSVNETIVDPVTGETRVVSSVGPEGSCDDPSGGQDILLTNSDRENEGFERNLAIRLFKSFDYELFNTPGTFNFNAGYAYTDSEIVNPTTSSTAGSNLEEVALSVVNNPTLAPSQFNIPHNITIGASFQQDFFEGLTSNLGFFFRASKGRPFSLTFSDDATEDFFGDTDDEARQLLFIPTGPNDPRFDFSNVAQDELNAFFAGLESIGADEFGGQIAPRNVFNDPWTTDLDIRFRQDLPTFFEGHKLIFFADIENFLNFVDSGGNRRKQFDRGDVFEGVPLMDVSGTNDQGQFLVNSVDAPVIQDDFVNTVWRVQFGIRYEF
ncbi:TonB-dependent receptor [Yunchengibacter salinarum]|uniref:TonB-dependent receptor n=1 Tax=Yunchengibacter salinarum TaxID=3133399 RepID=UPI0035B58B70